VTTAEDHDRLRDDLAGYVLGGLTVEEQHALEAHLAECTACRAELSELDPIPVLLELAPPAGPVPVRAVGDGDITVLEDEPALLEVGAEPELELVGASATSATSAAAPVRRLRRRRTLVGATLTSLAMAAAFLVGLAIATPSEPAYSAPVALHAPGPGSPAAGTVAVRADDHGTEVHLVAQNLPATKDVWYECLWWSASGAKWSAGTFKAGPSQTSVDLRTAAGLHPGWRLAILEHVAGQPVPKTVLETTT
jgi:anti-sigma factor RsiW